MTNYQRSGLVYLHVIAWPSTRATIPNGWQLCDGTNGTPDLRSKFVRGAVAGNNPGTTGGADTVTLDQTMLPSHNHGLTDPQHNHVWGNQAGSNSGATPSSAAESGDATTSGNTANVTFNNTGGGLSHENRPQFYQTVFICKMVTN